MLRRALIFLCLAAPLAAGAQTTDGVLITLRDSGGNVLTTPLGRIRCSGVTGFDDPRVSFTWSLAPQTPTTPAYATNDTYRISATKDSVCPTSPTSGAGLIDSVAAISATGSYPASGNTLLLSTVLADIPVDCSASTADLTIRLCVSLVRGSNGTVDKTINNSFVIQLAPPPDPVGLSVTPGDSALNIAWAAGTKGTGQADNDRYQVLVTPRTPAQDPGGTRSKITAATSWRQPGLVNGVLYDVVVSALSAGGNASVGSINGSGTPAPVNDFYTQYKADGGQEEGGCAGGPAGLLSLLGLGAALRLLRRRS
jgi:hypothetical protein